MIDEKEQLRPCPFCGGEAHMMFNPRIGWKDGAWKAGCKTVCVVVTQWWSSETEATKAWNKRDGVTT